MWIVLALIGNSLALWATTFVPGISWRGDLVSLLVAGLVLGLFNLIVRPIAMLLSLPLLIVTLGLFYFVLNGILLWVFSLLIDGYTVNGLIPAMIGALVMGVVNWAVGAVSGKS